jgi:hypothetical protein
MLEGAHESRMPSCFSSTDKIVVGRHEEAPCLTSVNKLLEPRHPLIYGDDASVLRSFDTLSYIEKGEYLFVIAVHVDICTYLEIG